MSLAGDNSCYVVNQLCTNIKLMEEPKHWFLQGNDTNSRQFPILPDTKGRPTDHHHHSKLTIILAELDYL